MARNGTALLKMGKSATDFKWSAKALQDFAPFTEKADWAKDVLQNETLQLPLKAALVDVG